MVFMTRGLKMKGGAVACQARQAMLGKARSRGGSQLIWGVTSLPPPSQADRPHPSNTQRHQQTIERHGLKVNINQTHALFNVSVIAGELWLGLKSEVDISLIGLVLPGKRDTGDYLVTISSCYKNLQFCWVLLITGSLAVADVIFAADCC